MKPLEIPEQWIPVKDALPIAGNIVRVRNPGGTAYATRMLVLCYDVYGQAFPVWMNQFGPLAGFEIWEEWLYSPGYKSKG